ncbi:hypothetical protein [Bacillus thuringiensis]|uniref:hypothetical protein n=1 Tax=Bacillus thuringiensis TaxID=1428 RepID=UPI00159BEDAE
MSLNRVEQTDLKTFLFIEPILNVPFGGDGQETPRSKCIHPITSFGLWAHTTRTRIVTDATGALWKEQYANQYSHGE